MVNEDLPTGACCSCRASGSATIFWSNYALVLSPTGPLSEIFNNNVKCSELGWVCIPLAVETYGNWGKEASDTFARLATRLAVGSSKSKSNFVFVLYSGTPNMHAHM